MLLKVVSTTFHSLSILHEIVIMHGLLVSRTPFLFLLKRGSCHKVTGGRKSHYDLFSFFFACSPPSPPLSLLFRSAYVYAGMYMYAYVYLFVCVSAVYLYKTFEEFLKEARL